jgi:hypothetical protein
MLTGRLCILRYWAAYLTYGDAPGPPPFPVSLGGLTSLVAGALGRFLLPWPAALALLPPLEVSGGVDWATIESCLGLGLARG